MDYGGHGSATLISHESVLGLSDFSESYTSSTLSLWLTAAFDIMPSRWRNGNNRRGSRAQREGRSRWAFDGTAYTVFTSANKYINHAFMKRVLSLHRTASPLH